MSDEPLTVGQESKRMFLATIPDPLKPEAEQWIQKEIAEGRMIWDASEAQPCKA